MGGPVAEDPAAQIVQNPIELSAQGAERKLWFKFPHQMARNCCAWSASKNRNIIRTGRKMNRKIKVNKKVYVANLPFETSEPELKAFFSNAGDVMSINIVKDRYTGQPKGFAFVEMSNQWEARRAVSMLNQRNFLGKDLLVKEARVSRGFRERE
jgi:RNA recognition motif-containing protein